MCTRGLLSLILLLALAAGCSEGGIGGTGSVVPGPDPLLVSGQANKGPFDAGAVITATRLSGAGQVQAETVGRLGEFSLSLLPDAAYQIRVNGRYFSETGGVVPDAPVTLTAVVSPRENEPVNVNVATHLIHRRVLALIDDGTAASTAIDMATSELVATLSPLLPAPANPLEFTQLALINAAQAQPNEEGNAWLLALGALIEIAAGPDVGELLDSLATGFAVSGRLDSNLLTPLQLAMRQVNPDDVHASLIGLEPAFSQGVLVASGAFTQAQAALANCRVFGSTLLCTGEMALPAGSLDNALGELASATSETFSISSLVADMNRFIDSDGDGLVNAVDPDDDNDGIADSADAAPYDNQLPATPGGVM
ncbi:MAG: thrombospondin type 3 repeat-containing protein [Pseudomonadota bacterium]